MSQNGYGTCYTPKYHRVVQSTPPELLHMQQIKGWELYELIYIRGHHLPLRLTFPPPRTPHGFACSVASLSRSPCHYPPGHHSVIRVALVECPLGQGKPSTQPVGRSADTHTPSASPHSGDRKAQPSPAGQISICNLPHNQKAGTKALCVPVHM